MNRTKYEESHAQKQRLSARPETSDLGVRVSKRSGRPFTTRTNQLAVVEKQIDVLDRVADAMSSGTLSSKTLTKIQASRIVMSGKDGWYVYCLQDSEMKVLYVGQTTNVWRRVGQHLDSGKTVDNVSVFSCRTREHMDSLEREMIRAFQPPLNSVMYKQSA